MGSRVSAGGGPALSIIGWARVQRFKGSRFSALNRETETRNKKIKTCDTEDQPGTRNTKPARNLQGPCAPACGDLEGFPRANTEHENAKPETRNKKIETCDTEDQPGTRNSEHETQHPPATFKVPAHRLAETLKDFGAQIRKRKRETRNPK